MNCKVTSIFILIFCGLSSVKAWDDDDYLIFDLVEEINQNFYNFMGIKQVCFYFIFITWKIFHLLCLFRMQHYKKLNVHFVHYP